MSAHTPTPWRVSPPTGTTSRKSHWKIASGDQYIAELWNDSQEENAVLIVNYVNTHDSLARDAERYRWLRDNVKETPLDRKRFAAAEFGDMRLKYELPVLCSLTCINSVISFDDAIDIAKAEAA